MQYRTMDEVPRCKLHPTAMHQLKTTEIGARKFYYMKCTECGNQYNKWHFMMPDTHEAVQMGEDGRYVYR